MNNWTVDKIRQTWLDFWKTKQHYVLPSKSLIPENDPTLLWINSGVATLKKYFCGLENPPAKRLTNVQKAIRTNDIENIGVTSRHHSFFEMLGNFSVGDYFKKEAITWAYELLVDKYKLDPQKLYFTVYKDDKETYEYWLKLKVQPDHIIKCDKDRNFWDIGSGPCGPCTEIYYDRGPKYDLFVPKKGLELFYKDIENDRFVEIWNIVFSQYNNDGHNNYNELARKNIDTGAGLERLACVLQNTPTNFEIDVFIKVIKVLETLTTFKYDQEAFFNQDKNQLEINTAYKIIIDHLRACCFAIADGAIPSNKERGYVLRKLLRRAMIYAQKLQIKTSFMEVIAKKIIEVMSTHYQDLAKKQTKIIEILVYEENLFSRTIKNGFDLFNKIVANKKNKISSEDVFKLHDTYGFPLEIIIELAKKSNLKINLDEVNKIIEQHKQKSSSILPQHNKVWAQQNADLLAFKEPSNFLYDTLQVDGKIIGIFDQKFKQINEINSLGKYWIVFDQTTIYALAGGQDADQGQIKIKTKSYDVIDCINGPNGQHFHCIEIKENNHIKINDKATITTNPSARKILSFHHTSIHLLHSALDCLISDKINQEGTSKTIEKATFDFHYHKRLTDQQLQQVEDQVNEWINKGRKVTTEHLTLQEAKAKKAIANFDSVYSKINGKLNVVKIGDISYEVCCGTHVQNIADIHQFHITKLIAKGSGDWRLEIIAGDELTNKWIQNENQIFKNKINEMKKIISQLTNNSKPSKISRIEQFISSYKDANTWQELKENRKKIEEITTTFNLVIRDIQKDNENLIIQKLIDNFKPQEKNTYQLLKISNQPNALVISLAQKIVNVFRDKIFLLLAYTNDKIFCIITKNKKCKDTKNVSCSQLLKEMLALVNGKGGGNDAFAQGSTIFDQKNLKIIESWLAKKN